MGRPVIGITCSSEEVDEEGRHVLKRAYVRCILSAGGLPLVLANPGEEDITAEMCSHLDGILLSGGVDLDPMFYGEDPVPGLGKIDPARDFFELALCRYAYARQIPVLGICRGIQVMNVAAGGSLYQDLEDQVENCLKHFQQAPPSHPTHTVVIDRRLFGGFGFEEVRVNSFHHQAVKRPGRGFEVCARSKDGVVEAIRMPDHIHAVGVQWHLEAMAGQDQVQERILDGFIAAAERRRQKRIRVSGRGEDAAGRGILNAAFEK